MAAPFEELSSLDRLVHEPARLAILTALGGCDAADFVFLQSLTGLTNGNLWTHLEKLEQAGLVEIDKSSRGRAQRTTVRLTKSGRESIDEHWARLQDLHKRAARWKRTLRRRLVEQLQGS